MMFCLEMLLSHSRQGQRLEYLSAFSGFVDVVVVLDDYLLTLL